jgi:hypothetical protein
LINEKHIKQFNNKEAGGVLFSVGAWMLLFATMSRWTVEAGQHHRR